MNQYTEKKGLLLDIGCGTGYFLLAAKQNGWKTWGIEPNDTARKIASGKKLKVSETLDDYKKSKKFDAISLYHVLEHIHDLRKSGKKIINLLKDNGTLFIAVPNIESYDAKAYGTNWAAFDVPRHLYHFNQETIRAFAEEMGLQIVGIEPQKFDSYYVSLLSENFQNANSNKFIKMINAFVTGYKSNNWAKKNNNNYSSLLFILKKKNEIH
ncbi:class I SAM-dependent methyltransferase [Aquiflexum sp. AIY15W]|nr:class I SAM-dependent methyltransferase [Cognataquiflexum rubidum]MCH6233859.1 class I SAM-dependent methyltransferase [Cognataquiflexum rubidum]